MESKMVRRRFESCDQPIPFVRLLGFVVTSDRIVVAKGNCA